MTGRGARLAFAFVLCATTSCGVHGLDLKTDKRLTFIAPKDRAKVTLPITISWRVRDFKITGPDGERLANAGYFGIYVDGAPQPPELDQVWLLRNDTTCRRTHTCANRDVLNQANIFSTTETKFTVEHLAPPPTNAVKRREIHEVTIALLNGRGERIGESAFRREFEVDRGDSG